MTDFETIDTQATVTFIYALIDPATKQARYVGKSQNPVQRFRQHLNDGRLTLERERYRPVPKDVWMAQLIGLGKVPLLAILEETGCEEIEWRSAEQRWIARLSDEGHPLLNGQVVRAKFDEEAVLQDALELGRELFGPST